MNVSHGPLVRTENSLRHFTQRFIIIHKYCLQLYGQCLLFTVILHNNNNNNNRVRLFIYINIAGKRMNIHKPHESVSLASPGSDFLGVYSTVAKLDLFTLNKKIKKKS